MPLKGGSKDKQTSRHTLDLVQARYLIKRPDLPGPAAGLPGRCIAASLASSVQRLVSHFLPLTSLSGIYSVRAAPLPHARQTGSVTRCEKAPIFPKARRHPPVKRLRASCCCTPRVCNDCLTDLPGKGKASGFIGGHASCLYEIQNDLTLGPPWLAWREASAGGKVCQ